MKRRAATACSKNAANQPQDTFSEGLKALGHPVRLEIVRQLAARDRCCAGDFCSCLPLAQSTISQHLEMLLAAGIVNRRPEGTKSIFTLNRTRLNELVSALQQLAADDSDAIPFKDAGEGVAMLQGNEKARS